MQNNRNFSTPGSNATGNCCPYLGLAGDPLICYAYPSENNMCYRVAKQGAILESYQENFCLTPKHETCEVYKNNNIKQLPDEIKKLRGKRKIKALAIILPIVGFVCIVLPIILYFFLSLFGDVTITNPFKGSASLLPFVAIIAYQPLSTSENVVETFIVEAIFSEITEIINLFAII
jgi:hypothetical protein